MLCVGVYKWPKSARVLDDCLQEPHVRRSDASSVQSVVQAVDHFTEQDALAPLPPLLVHERGREQGGSVSIVVEALPNFCVQFDRQVG